MVQRDYEIILSPDLGISPADFAAAWNEIAAENKVGEAHDAIPNFV
jgi:hypothetical protein